MKQGNEKSFSAYAEKVLLRKVACIDIIVNTYCKNSSKATAGNKRGEGIEGKLLRTLSLYKIVRRYYKNGQK